MTAPGAGLARGRWQWVRFTVPPRSCPRRPAAHHATQLPDPCNEQAARFPAPLYGAGRGHRGRTLAGVPCGRPARGWGQVGRGGVIPADRAAPGRRGYGRASRRSTAGGPARLRRGVRRTAPRGYTSQRSEGVRIAQLRRERGTGSPPRSAVRGYVRAAADRVAGRGGAGWYASRCGGLRLSGGRGRENI